jgi:hypothetical protein
MAPLLSFFFPPSFLFFSSLPPTLLTVWSGQRPLSPYPFFLSRSSSLSHGLHLLNACSSLTLLFFGSHRCREQLAPCFIAIRVLLGSSSHPRSHTLSHTPLSPMPKLLFSSSLFSCSNISFSLPHSLTHAYTQAAHTSF